MSVLSALTQALRGGGVEIIDLTAPLSASTPGIKLPEPFGHRVSFSLRESHRYHERGTGKRRGPRGGGGGGGGARGVGEGAGGRGRGVERAGPGAGAAPSFVPPFPCHAAMLGAGKYGLTQLRNLVWLPALGAVLVV